MQEQLTAIIVDIEGKNEKLKEEINFHRNSINEQTLTQEREIKKIKSELEEERKAIKELEVENRELRKNYQ